MFGVVWLGKRPVRVYTRVVQTALAGSYTYITWDILGLDFPRRLQRYVAGAIRGSKKGNLACYTRTNTDATIQFRNYTRPIVQITVSPSRKCPPSTENTPQVGTVVQRAPPPFNQPISQYRARETPRPAPRCSPWQARPPARRHPQTPCAGPSSPFRPSCCRST